MAKVTYTYWRHYTCHSEEMGSMLDALERAEHDADYNYAAPESITTASGRVLDSKEIGRYWDRHQKLARVAGQREQQCLLALRYETGRSITWKEASRIMRRLRWKPSIANQRSIAFLVASVWGKERHIVSVAQLRSMTPAQFWQRLRHLDPYRVAEVERNIF